MVAFNGEGNWMVLRILIGAGFISSASFHTVRDWLEMDASALYFIKSETHMNKD